MKKSNLIKLGDAITQILSQQKLDVKLSQFSVKNGWKDIVGDVVARNTSSIYFSGKSLFVTIDSAALRHELSFRRTELVTLVNRFCGYQLIDEIIIK